MTNAPDQDSDSDWEYEYSTTETSTFYIPIDLSHIPDAQAPFINTQRQGHPTLLKSRVRALNAKRAAVPILAGTPSSASPAVTGPAAEGEAETALQITGLHTPNPLVSYNNQILSCHWAQTLGTDFFFAGAEARGDDAPLRELPGDRDLLGMSSAKLVARKAVLRPRDGVEEDVDVGDADADGDVEMRDGEGEQDQTGNVEEAAPAAAQPPQSSFLARLNAAKARRGETTKLAVSSSAAGKRVVAEPVDSAAGRG